MIEPARMPTDILSAYRAELTRRSAQPGGSPSAVSETAREGVWLSVGILLQHAANATMSLEAMAARARREELLQQARVQLREYLADGWDRGPSLDPDRPADDRALSPRVRLLCEEIENAGATELADAILVTYLLADLELSDLERARCHALRARLAWKRGDQEGAAALYDEIASLGNAKRLPELRARAAVGHAILARLRGNYPEARAAASEAVDLAESSGFRRIAALGHHMLMTVDAMAGRIDDAVAHAWHAFRNVEGDPAAEGAQLVDLARLFYDAGHHEIAAAGFDAALKRPLPAHLRFHALGGRAITAAREGRPELLSAIEREIATTVEELTLPWPAASAWLDIAEAWSTLGQRDRTREARSRVLQLASEHRYHEMMVKAERIDVQSREVPSRLASLTDASREIGHAIRLLAAAG